ncbi:metal-dependent hydrolase of the TIM-barrel fold [Pyrenophora tritici-repentis]|uniref:Metal-dependent hydrolase of the TIM-barrel fold n=2 Tax=Pyrenophora tritici-repentis TaxID=45151 RepID=A0A2W1F798_9PLEO|nr:uncharacterized protein PTRG_04537 [Pyrenophora tritici-repentis Pt-1C-BFP]KAA8612714.1 metal-dependent hydrolase of the TIM-barrel fold [Pyrenophora tritici-repentis]EDU47444.1 conserved hypothetical protein [Pyrenophora tritici-repentis Pt-1C-BFP]KAF7446763.1 putative metal-dependent hydrolase of the TIM-barrel fold [Pyrenophora tritici-repentis]KAI0586004.1 metal-dependent hydrolase of the TIM-barrel fold [Pyrenophora tritici-repentis]KAI0589059.1 metal-dependent hydrolase of the TIM-bar
MAPQQILDTHIHLWPSTATSSSNHSWMTRGNILAKRHGISDYLAITSPPPQGFIYVETDRRLPSAEPNIPDSASSSEIRKELESWAKEPLDELRFLRRIAEGTPEEGDGFMQEHGNRMFGCVIYAPFHLSPKVFNEYLAIAKDVAGEKLWSKVAGFRYLLQGKGDGAVSKMLKEQGEWWESNLCALKALEGTSDAWCFDVGVDTHRDGVEPMEAVALLIKRVRAREDREDADGKRVKFVLNHLAKPPLSTTSSNQPNPRWLSALSTLSPDKNIYMKLSGALNEFDNQPTPADVPTLLSALTPYFEHAFHCFPQRVMFGSDWPVCNVGGPAGEEGNWGLWRDVVEAWMDKVGMAEKEREKAWWGAGVEAYGLEGLKG